jgi:hypothetical protein
VIDGERREKSMFRPEPIVVIRSEMTHIRMVLHGLYHGQLERRVSGGGWIGSQIHIIVADGSPDFWVRAVVHQLVDKMILAILVVMLNGFVNCMKIITLKVRVPKRVCIVLEDLRKISAPRLSKVMEKN